MESCHLQPESVFTIEELNDDVHEDSFCFTAIPSIPSFGVLNERADTFIPQVHSFVSIALPEMYNDNMVSDSLCAQSNQDCLSTESSCLNSVESFSSSWYNLSLYPIIVTNHLQLVEMKAWHNVRDLNVAVST